MPVSNAPRTGITRWSAEADPFNRTQTDADHALLDDLVAIDLHDGALAVRPAVGVRGRYFTESAASAGLPGATWREDGAAWRALGSRVLSTGTTDIAQVVAGVTGQTANLVEWRAGASTLGHLDSTGQLFAVGAQLGPSPQTALAAMLGVTPSTAAAVAAILRGAVSQTGDLQQWQANAGTVLARVDSAGAGTFAGLTTAGTVTGRLARWTSAATGDIPVIVKGFAGQTGDLTEWQNSAGAVISYIDAAGKAGFGVLGVGAVPNTSYQALFVSTAATVVPAVARGAAAQTADLQQWQNSAGAVQASVDPLGVIHTGSSFLNGNNSGFPALMAVPTATGQPGAVVKGLASQSADLQQWQSSAGTVLAALHSDGSFVAGNPASYDNTAFINASCTTATAKGIVARGAASQTADLQQWQNSAGAAQASINPFGSMQLGGSTGYLGRLTAYTGGTTIIGAVIRGFAAQTAHLQEWQSSTGTVLSFVDQGGSVQTQGGAGFFSNLASVGLATSSAWNVLAAGGTGVPVVIVKAASGNTSRLQEWHTGAGSVAAYVDSGGNVAGTGAYTTLSDVAVKRNIRPLQRDPLTVLRGLEPKHFDYTDGSEVDQVGFVAQDLARVLPQAVVPFDERRLGVRSDAILGYLVAAVQELDRRIAA